MSKLSRLTFACACAFLFACEGGTAQRADGQTRTDLIVVKSKITSEALPFHLEKQYESYEKVQYLAHRLRGRTGIRMQLHSVKSDAMPEFPIFKLFDKTGDGTPDEYGYYVDDTKTDTKEFGYFFDNPGQGDAVWIVFNMGILLSKDLKDSDWGTYHAIDTNRDGRTDVLVLNFPDVDGDGWMDIGSRAWVYDRNYDGRVDAAEHVSATGEVIPLEPIEGKYDLRLSFKFLEDVGPGSQIPMQDFLDAIRKDIVTFRRSGTS